MAKMKAEMETNQKQMAKMRAEMETKQKQMTKMRAEMETNQEQMSAKMEAKMALITRSLRSFEVFWSPR
jgi:septal ring factor EnvC (AmiA/AmiB activator)